MKRIFAIFILCTLAIICALNFTACSEETFNVKFIVDGEVYYTVATNGGETIVLPDSPTKSEFTFDGWYLDKDTWENIFTENSILGSSLSSDLNVYAKFKLNHVHDYIETVTKEPTCAEKGEKTFTCECGDVYTEEINALGHTPANAIEENKVAPTCTENGGYDTVIYCSVCGEKLTREHKMLNATGHNYKEKVTDPTCTEKGYTTHTCDRCNDSYKDNYTDELGFLLSFLSSDNAAGKITGSKEQRVLQGNTSDQVVAVPNLGYKFVRWSNGELNTELTVKANNNETYYAIFQIDALELPIMQINTQQAQAITSKEEYVKCNVSVSNTDFKYVLNNESAKIRGRGNSTWSMPKKPYKLKFDSKIDLFGNGKAKTWTLIANYADPSIVRNYIAYSVGAVFEELNGYTTTTQNVELYLNGEYQGVYLICEQTETGKTRVDIADALTDKKTGENVAPKDIGYLIEMDGRAPDEGVEGVDYFYISTTPYGIKSPDTDDDAFSTEYVEYISEYMENCYSAIFGNDINAVKELIDLESFASTYIVHELFNCVDCGYSSVYMYKMPNGKLYSGPLWDFDLSVGNCNYGIDDVRNARSLYAKNTNGWYSCLLKFDEFNEIVKNQLENYSDIIASTISNCIENVKTNENSFNRNFEKWQILGTYVWPNTDEMVAIDTWEGQLDYVENWLTESLEYLISVYVD